MKAEKDKVVVLTYSLSEGNAEGEMIQIVDEKEPFEFLFGYQNVLPEFESHLDGAEVGQTFSFSIPKDKAYGDYDENAVSTLSKDIFNIEDKEAQEEMLQVGNVLPMIGPEEMPMDGLITRIEGDEVEMDFNHPLAGIDLYFEGKVIDVRDATEEELKNEGFL